MQFSSPKIHQIQNYPWLHPRPCWESL